VAFAEGDNEKKVMENCTLKEKKRFAKLLFFISALVCTRHDAQITRHGSLLPKKAEDGFTVIAHVFEIWVRQKSMVWVVFHHENAFRKQ
jgi:hypothetical protein